MKKYILSLIFVLTLIPSISFAEITMDPANEQVEGVGATITCDVPEEDLHDWLIYDSTGTMLDFSTCSTTNNGVGPFSIDTYKIVECDTTASALCEAGLTYTEIIVDSGYVSEVDYAWVSEPDPESCSDGIQNQDETGVDVGGVCGTYDLTSLASDIHDIRNVFEMAIYIFTMFLVLSLFIKLWKN